MSEAIFEGRIEDWEGAGRTRIFRIVPDVDPWNPREWDNLGHMVCWHSRYVLGDEQRRDGVHMWLEELAEGLDTAGVISYWYDRASATEWAKVRGDGCSNGDWYNYADQMCEKAIARIVAREVIMLPLFLSDHSGLAMSTSSGAFRAFDSAGWDWGQVGFIYVTRAEVLREYGAKRLTRQLRERVEERLRGEVRTYNAYLHGYVYGWEVVEEVRCNHGHTHEEHLDSCWGFIDDYDRTDQFLEALRAEVPQEYRPLIDAGDWNY